MPRLRKTAVAAFEIKLKGHDPNAFYLAVLGTPQGVPLFDAITHLGRDILRERLRHAMELLGPASKKEVPKPGPALLGDRLKLRLDERNAIALARKLEGAIAARISRQITWPG